MLEPKTNYQLFNMIIGFEYKDARATLCWASYLSQSEHVVEQPAE